MGNLTEDEFNQLKQLEGTKNAIHHDLGALATQQKRLHKGFENLEEQSEKFRNELVEKYGKINVDLKDGSFKEVEEVEEEVKE
tara:strand:- start:2719 stop:2967 length:249 start_codon:yes stop_codon:yes gene_type:complete